jgi:hypothetical protein
MSNSHRTLAKQIRPQAATEKQESKGQAPRVANLENRAETNQVFRQWFESWSMRRHQQGVQSE